jgi:hypothetical protein
VSGWLRNCWYMAGRSDELGERGMARLDSAQAGAVLTELLVTAFAHEDKPMIDTAYANARGWVSRAGKPGRSASPRAARAPAGCSSR